MWEAFSCDALTGQIRDTLPVVAGPSDRLLSARGSADVTVMLDGTHTKAALRSLTDFWLSLIVLTYNGTPRYMGFVTWRGYVLGKHEVKLRLTDLWGLWDRRGAWDHNEPHVEKWSVTVNGSLARHAAAAVLRGLDGPAVPSMSLPVNVPSPGGASVSRPYYGYHLETVGDVLRKLLDEGLDIYFEPRWAADGHAEWTMRAGPEWRSGSTREFFASAPMSAIAEFSETGDGTRITNNARYVGEGTEVDMLVRSNRNLTSPYPLLDRSTPAKTVGDVNQLTALANQDLVAYASATLQWDFKVHLDQGVGVGDMVRINFDGDPWIEDGWYESRIVKLSDEFGSHFTNVSVQPVGGA